MELIKINDTSDNITVDGRDLHAKLEVKTPYHKWFPRMCEYGFEEGKDFSTFLSESINEVGSEIILDKKVQNKNIEETRGRKATNHQLTIQMAKEICMLQRTNKGKQFRQYFIEVENNWNSPEKIMARALQLANRTIDNLKIENQTIQNKLLEAQPKIIFANAVATSKTSILIGDLAKILKSNGINIGQKRLFNWMRENGYLIKRKGGEYNSPTQKAMNLGLFELKETAITRPDGHVLISKTTKVTGKGQEYFINRFLSETLYV